MEEEKAAAYYDELTRKGEGAARFKQGLGFSASTSNDDVPKPGSSFLSSSSFLSQFVKPSSSTPSNPPEPDKKFQLQSIQNKLRKKPTEESRVSKKSNYGSSSNREKERDRIRRRSRSRSRSRERYREKGRDSRKRSRSRERYNNRYSDRDRDAQRIRSDSDGDRGRDRERERRRRRSRSRSRSRSVSPRKQRSTSDRGKMREMQKGKNAGVDYAKLIKGYDNMSPAERVKAKMKLQLSETAAHDSERGAGWERFEFNKDAPLDDEEVEDETFNCPYCPRKGKLDYLCKERLQHAFEIHLISILVKAGSHYRFLLGNEFQRVFCNINAKLVAEDDASLVKHIGQSFRFSTVEAKREEQIQAAHDEAMFGVSSLQPPISTDSEPERENEKETDKKDLVSSLLSETVLAKQKGSWRDRVRRG